MKKVSDLTDKELMFYLINKDKKCQYCSYNDCCYGRVVSSGGGDPIFPACVDNPEDVIYTVLSFAKEDKDLMNKEVE